MSQPFRLNKEGLINRNKKISFTFNGKKLFGYEGDTIASALIANGIHLAKCIPFAIKADAIVSPSYPNNFLPLKVKDIFLFRLINPSLFNLNGWLILFLL